MRALIKKSNGKRQWENIRIISLKLASKWQARDAWGVRKGLCKTKALRACWKTLQLVKSKQSSSKSWISPLQIENYGGNNSREKSFSRKPQYTFLEMQVLGMTRTIWEIVWKVSQETSYIEPSILRQLLLKLPHKDGLKQTRKCYKKFK